MDKSELLAKINERNEGTLMQTLHIEFIEIGDDYLVASMPVNETVLQPDGVLHGGATAALAETVGSSAAAIFCLPENHMLRGIDVSAKHVRGVLQPDGVLHGGATAALAETVGSSAAAIFCLPENHMLRGIDVSAKHVRGVRSGIVFAKAIATHRGKTMQVWSIEITDDQNRLISSCSLTTLILPNKK